MITDKTDKAVLQFNSLISKFAAEPSEPDPLCHMILCVEIFI